VKSSRSGKSPHLDQSVTNNMSGSSSGLFHLYGRKPILEALKLHKVRSLEISARAHGRTIADIVSLAQEQHIPINRVESFAEEEGHTLQGIRAFAEPPPLRHDLRKFVHDLPEKPYPLLLMLDGILDPQNFGAILRTADGAGVSAVIIRERRQAPVTDVVVKSSAGAAYVVPLFQVTNLHQTLRLLAENGFWSVATVAEEGAKPYREYRWNSRTILIVGAEGAGVSELLKKEADDRISIPMHGKLDSLNVSVATGIILYEAATFKFREDV
jgi:23S rRNA (guanosine2251-2'-O)-methyltransferase